MAACVVVLAQRGKELWEQRQRGSTIFDCWEEKNEKLLEIDTFFSPYIYLGELVNIKFQEQNIRNCRKCSKKEASNQRTLTRSLISNTLKVNTEQKKKEHQLANTKGSWKWKVTMRHNRFLARVLHATCLLFSSLQNSKILKDSCHIESLNTCMKY